MVLGLAGVAWLGTTTIILALALERLCPDLQRDSQNDAARAVGDGSVPTREFIWWPLPRRPTELTEK